MNNYFAIFTLLITFFLCSSFLVWCFKAYALKKNLLDHPNERSSHVIPVPRGGGIIFPILMIVYILIDYFLWHARSESMLAFVPAIFVLGLISFLDDRFGVKPKWRLLIHCLVAVYSVYLIGGFETVNIGKLSIYLGKIGFILASLAIIWSTNLYNFMDGIDGIASVESLFVLGCGGYFIWSVGGYEFAKLIWVMAAVVAGFLVWNWPPSKIFMGDVGSSLLGFLIITFGIIGEVKYKIPLLLWVILYGIFWFDATVTLVRRIIHGDDCSQAHRLHAYQRLQLIGWSHKKILKWLIAVNTFLALLALMANSYPIYAVFLLVLAFVTLCFIYIWIENRQPMYNNI